MNRVFFAFAIAAVAALTVVAPAQAHFIYLKQSAGENATKVEGFFGHGPVPDEPALLSRLDGLEVWWTPTEGERTLVPLSLSADRMVGSAPTGEGMLSAKTVPAVREREGVAYRSIGYAQTAPELESSANIPFADGTRPDLELRAYRTPGGKLRLTAYWKGKPLPQVEVAGSVPGLSPVHAMTDDKGGVELDLDKPGFVDFHVQYVEPGAGELDGKKFTETRHNVTLVVETAGKNAPAPK